MIDFNTICILYSRQEAKKTHWVSKGHLRSWRFDITKNVVFDKDAASCPRKKNLQRMFNYCRGSALTCQFRTPITSAGCPTTRSVEFLRTIPPIYPSPRSGTSVRSSRYPRLCTTRWVWTFSRDFPALLFNIDFRSIMNRARLKSFIFFDFSIALQITDRMRAKPTLTLLLNIGSKNDLCLFYKIIQKKNTNERRVIF